MDTELQERFDIVSDAARELETENVRLIGKRDALEEAAGTIEEQMNPHLDANGMKILRVVLRDLLDPPKKEEKVSVVRSGPVSAYVERYNAMDKELAALKEAALAVEAGAESSGQVYVTVLHKEYCTLMALVDPPKKPGLREAAEAIYGRPYDDAHRANLRTALDAEPDVDWRAWVEKFANEHSTPEWLNMRAEARRLLEEHP